MTLPWYELAFDRLYPVLYGHRDESEARRVVGSYGALFAGAGPVLDLACGDGRYVSAFGKAGVDVRGLDLSPFLLREAIARRGLRGRVVRGDMRRLPVRTGAVGGVLSMFTSFGYFDDDVDNLRVLKEVARVLMTGGVFLFDFVNAGRIIANPPGDTRAERGGYTIEESRSLEDEARYIVKRVVATPGDGGDAVRYEERVRLYRPSELETMLSSAGLAVAETYGDYDRAAFDTVESQRIIFVCEKK